MGARTMNAADNLSLAADLAREAAVYESATTQHALMGRVFDYNTPHPPMPHNRPREWETDTKEQR
jgi:hypothetical protein